MDRALTADEQGILDFVLADPAIRGGDALRAQIHHARVIDDEPLPTWIHLAVDADAPVADHPDGMVASVEVGSPSGETTGFILLWVRGGRLDFIEHAWVTDEMPTRLPSPGQLRR